MLKLITLAAVLLAACSGVGGDSTTSLVATTGADETTTTTPLETTSTQPPVECPPAPYDLTVLPFGVGQGLIDPDSVEPDVWTSVGGTNTTFWGRPDGSVAIALIRGTLPAVDWPGDKGEVFVDGTRAAVGPHPDGTWVMGWFVEPQERCDLYTMVFYPPISPEEVEDTINGMVRIAG